MPFTRIVISETSELLRRKYDTFVEKLKWCKGWLGRALRRLKTKPSVRLYREAGSVGKGAVSSSTVSLCQKLQKYLGNRIYNHDERGLSYQLLPNISYLAPEEKTNEACGINSMRAKSIVTLDVSANVIGVLLRTSIRERCYWTQVMTKVMYEQKFNE